MSTKERDQHLQDQDRPEHRAEASDHDAAPADHDAEAVPPLKKRRTSPLWLLAFSMIAVLIVLILSNMEALLRPIHTLNTVLTPITIGLVIAYLTNPLLRLFEYRVFFKLKSRRANRALSLTLSYLVIFAMISGVVLLLVPRILSAANDLSINGLVYIDNIINSVNRIISSIPFIEQNPDNLISLEKLLNFLLELVNNYGSTIAGGLGAFAGGMLTLLKNILVGFFVSLYVLLSKNRLNAGCRRVFRALLPSEKEKMLLYYLGKAHHRFGGFLIGKIIDSLLISVLCGVVLAIFRIPFAVPVAVIVGVTNIIPFFGPILGAVPSAAIIFIKDPMKALLFALLFLAIQLLDKNILAPIILGDSAGLSSLGILIAITVASGLLGFAGLLIGVPLFALLFAILDDLLTAKLRKKGSSTHLKDYYPANAFMRPQDLTKTPTTNPERLRHWIISVEGEVAGRDYTPSLRHSLGRGVRMACLRIGRHFGRFQPITPEELAASTQPPVESISILPQEPERPDAEDAQAEESMTAAPAVTDEEQHTTVADPTEPTSPNI